MDINALVAQAKANTAELEDQTQTTSGGDFEYEIAPEGLTPMRFVGYVETGKRPQRPYKGKDKPPADEVRLYFELNGKAHCREVEVEGQTKTFTNIIMVKLTKKLSDKATFVKLFKCMTYGRDGITHMAQMLGEAFIGKVIHNVVKGDPTKGTKDRTFANLRDDDGNWYVQAPVVVDPLTNESTPVPVPEVTVPVKLLLWDNPSQEQWDSIFIDGTRTVKDEKGVETEVSKNWLQEDILTKAINLPGSPLEALLGGLADLNLNAEPEAPAEGNVSAGAAQDTPAPETENADTAGAGESKPTSNENTSADVLASLGL